MKYESRTIRKAVKEIEEKNGFYLIFRGHSFGNTIEIIIR